MAQTGKVLIYGGKGALGSVLVNTFKAKNYVSISIIHLFSLHLIIDTLRVKSMYSILGIPVSSY